MAELLDSDLMLVNRSDTSYKVTGSEIKESQSTVFQPQILTPTDALEDAAADELIFVGSPPTGSNIKTWGNATWEVDTTADFGSAMTATKAITAGVTQTLSPEERGSITLEEETQYYVRLKYTSTDPNKVSDYSNVVTFETGSTDVIDDIINKSVPGDLYTMTDTKNLARMTLGDDDELAVTYGGNASKCIVQSVTGKIYTGLAGAINLKHEAQWDDVDFSREMSFSSYVSLLDRTAPNELRFYDVASTTPVSVFTYPENIVYWRGTPPSLIAILESGDIYLSRLSLNPPYGDPFKITGFSQTYQSIQVTGGSDTQWWGVREDGVLYTGEFNKSSSTGTLDGDLAVVSEYLAPEFNGMLFKKVRMYGNNQNLSSAALTTTGDIKILRDNNMLAKSLEDFRTTAVDEDIIEMNCTNAGVFVLTRSGRYFAAGKNISNFVKGPWIGTPSVNSWAELQTPLPTLDRITEYQVTSMGLIFPPVTNYSEITDSGVNNQAVIDQYGIDPETNPAAAQAIGIYPVTPADDDYAVSHYRKEDNGTYTAVPHCITMQEMEIVRVIRNFQDTLASFRARFGLPATQEIPQAIDGYYPLYTSEAESDLASDNGESHEHEINGVTYYMPDTGVHPLSRHLRRLSRCQLTTVRRLINKQGPINLARSFLLVSLHFAHVS